MRVNSIVFGKFASLPYLAKVRLANNLAAPWISHPHYVATVL
jgi:hypothetical protein